MIGELAVTVAFTVMTALAVLPSTVARTVAVPTASGDTSPSALTEAMSGCVDCHAMVGLTIALPLESLTSASSWSAPPGMNTVSASRTS